GRGGWRGVGTVAGLVVAAGALGAVALEGLQDDENDSLLSRTPFVSAVRAEEKTTPNAKAPPSIVSQNPPVDRAVQREQQGGADKPMRTKKRVVILGSGWAAVGVLRELDNEAYEVVVVSPRNYFLFTPLLPSVTVGTLDSRSVVESIRRTFKRAGASDVQFLNAECTAINHQSNSITCNDVSGDGAVRSFDLEYDQLIVAVGCDNTTFGTPGVEKYCHFLKELNDARRIRQQITQNFEVAGLPGQPEEEIKRLLHFVVVGGGPTGVEFAAELHDLLVEDLEKWFPRSLTQHVRITIIQSAAHILNTYDAKISDYAEKRFGRDDINVKPLCRVLSVDEKTLSYNDKQTNKTETLPYGMCVWATGTLHGPLFLRGIGPRPLVKKFCSTIKEQTNRRAIVTDSHLRVLGTTNVYAIGDCGTVEQRRLLSKFVDLFDQADENKDGVVSFDELSALVVKNKDEYPQLLIYAAKMQELFETVDLDKNQVLDREEFKALLTEVDKNLVELPATAQVASQEGKYLGQALNALARGQEVEQFHYKPLGSLAYIGARESVLELPGGFSFGGFTTWFAWRSAYLAKQVSWRNKFMVAMDWMKELLFGRDISKC
ncbi:pyridine nucleotidedisulfide oxidoreductase domain containing protein, partial [Acanthamoeba castellanii str. Neff]